jgi:MarR family transcriptional regulator for hemolysin
MSTMTPPRAEPDLSFLLSHTSHVLNTRLTAALAEIGMTVRGHCVLMHALPGELTQIELARLSDLDKTLDELEAAGLAQRRPAAADRRARIVQVTDEGRQVAAAGEQIVDRVHGEVLAALPADERDAFKNALIRLAHGYLATPAEGERPVRRPRQARGRGQAG